MRVGADGGRAEPFGALESEEVKRIAWGGVPGLSISPDGKRVAYGGRMTIRATNELWSLDLSSLLTKPR